MKRLIVGLSAGLLLFLNATPTWTCPECRAQVNSGVYGQGFTTILIVMLLPVVLLSLIGAAVYYADDIKAKLKGRTEKWQTKQNAHL